MICPECFTEYPDECDFCFVCNKKISLAVLHWECIKCNMHFVEYFGLNILCPKCGSSNIKLRENVRVDDRIKEFLKERGIIQ